LDHFVEMQNSLSGIFNKLSLRNCTISFKVNFSLIWMLPTNMKTQRKHSLMLIFIHLLLITASYMWPESWKKVEHILGKLIIRILTSTIRSKFFSSQGNSFRLFNLKFLVYNKYSRICIIFNDWEIPECIHNSVRLFVECVNKALKIEWGVVQ